MTGVSLIWLIEGEGPMNRSEDLYEKVEGLEERFEELRQHHLNPPPSPVDWNNLPNLHKRKVIDVDLMDEELMKLFDQYVIYKESRKSKE